MLICCWSSKGGSGTTVVAAALALLLAGRADGALLADLAGDAPTVLGLASEPTGVGISDWLTGAGPPDEVLVGPRLGVWSRGVAPMPTSAAAGDRLVDTLRAEPRPVVVDAGVLGGTADVGRLGRERPPRRPTRSSWSASASSRCAARCSHPCDRARWSWSRTSVVPSPRAMSSRRWASLSGPASMRPPRSREPSTPGCSPSHCLGRWHATSAMPPDRLLHGHGGQVRFGPLEPLLTDPSVTEIMVNGPGPVWVERAGELEQTDVVITRASLDAVLERVVAPLGLRLDPSSPLVDARLPDGSRVNAVVPPLAIDGPCLTIRRFTATQVGLDAFAPAGVAALLRWAVASRCNIVISGGTGAGKTTLLAALAAELPPGERIVTIEDAAELRLSHPHVVRLESRPANADGLGAISQRRLLRNALRMRPDRIIVGEVRGPEALDMLQAMNTGHEGSLSTCHANGPADALRRLETMVLLGEVLPLPAVRDQLTAALDLVVHVARSSAGRRRVVAVAEVLEAPEGVGRDARVRALYDGHALVSLPARPPRAAGAPPPSVRWLV